ncbi:Protein Brevis radix-like 3, partial [Ananas comosus]
VESLTRKLQLQEAELERTTKQLKEAVAIAGEETAKCKAAKEVIKSLTAQLKGMAERLPVGATKNNGRLPPVAPILTSETASTGIDFVNSPLNSSEPDSNGSNGFPFTHGASSISNLRRGSSDVVKNGSKVTDADGNNEPEWVEQYEPGVYITLGSLPGGARELRRVRFSRKRFSERQAEQWWAENRAWVYEKYNIRIVDKSTASIGNDEASH